MIAIRDCTCIEHSFDSFTNISNGISVVRVLNSEVLFIDPALEYIACLHCAGTRIIDVDIHLSCFELVQSKTHRSDESLSVSFIEIYKQSRVRISALYYYVDREIIRPETGCASADVSVLSHLNLAVIIDVKHRSVVSFFDLARNELYADRLLRLNFISVFIKESDIHGFDDFIFITHLCLYGVLDLRSRNRCDTDRCAFRQRAFRCVDLNGHSVDFLFERNSRIGDLFLCFFNDFFRLFSICRLLALCRLLCLFRVFARSRFLCFRRFRLFCRLSFYCRSRFRFRCRSRL